VVITGDVGAGKSTLVAHLMATIDRQRLTAAQIVTSRLSDTDLVQLAAQAFAIRAEGESALGRDPGWARPRPSRRSRPSCMARRAPVAAACWWWMRART
jgi:ABC-type glutathione transport system ATPase component